MVQFLMFLISCLLFVAFRQIFQPTVAFNVRLAMKK